MAASPTRVRPVHVRLADTSDMALDSCAVRDLHDELTAAKFDLENRDAMVAEARGATGEEIRQLRAELAAANLTIAGHDEALAGFRKTVAQAEERWRNDARDAMAKAKASWDKAILSQLAAVEAETRMESEAALAAMEARLKKSEAALAYIREKAPEHGTPHRETAEAADLRVQLAQLQKTFEEREVEFSKMRGMPGERRHAAPDRAAASQEEPAEVTSETGVEPKRPRHILVDLGLVAVVSVAAILLLPRLEALLPESWAYQIDSGIFSAETMLGLPPAAVASTPPATDVRKAIVPGTATSQAGSGVTDAMTLRGGVDIGRLDQRGNRTRTHRSRTRTAGRNGERF